MTAPVKTNFSGAFDEALGEFAREPKVDTVKFLARLPRSYHTIIKIKAATDGLSMNELVIGAVERYIVGEQ